MSSLTVTERQDFEKLLGMSGGYVLNFTDRTFGEFITEAVGLDIHSARYTNDGTSKAKKLRSFWKIEPDLIVGKLLLALIDYSVTVRVQTSQEDTALEERCRKTARKVIERGAEDEFAGMSAAATSTPEFQKTVPPPFPVAAAADNQPKDPATTESKSTEPEISYSDDNLLTQEGLVRAAIKLVPSFRWVVAGAALLALAAVVVKMQLNLATLFLVAGVILVLAIAFIALRWISKLHSDTTSSIAVFLAWAFLVLPVASLACVFTSAVTDWPWPIRIWITNQLHVPGDSTVSKNEEKLRSESTSVSVVPGGKDSTTPTPTSSSHQVIQSPPQTIDNPISKDLWTAAEALGGDDQTKKMAELGKRLQAAMNEVMTAFNRIQEHYSQGFQSGVGGFVLEPHKSHVEDQFALIKIGYSMPKAWNKCVIDIREDVFVFRIICGETDEEFYRTSATVPNYDKLEDALKQAMAPQLAEEIARKD